MTGPAGRFAPSPTGPLHLGSLCTALASFLDARSRGDRWLVRLDDLDTQRNRPGADGLILQALDAHGLHWDETVQRQSQRIDEYANALGTLASRELLFFCRCTRRTLRGRNRYPGTCRARVTPEPGCTVRVRTDDREVVFEDLRLGRIATQLSTSTGDFVIRRREGIYAYQLATAVDDGEPSITRVIRGRDLLGNTPRQIWLMRSLDLAIPRYGHLRLVINPAGQKLSKQTGATPVDVSTPHENVRRCLGFLGLTPPTDAHSVAELIAWAAGCWALSGVPLQDTVL